jgi:Zn-dependent protease
LQFLLSVFGAVNFNLALFNLIPVPPLDGARVLENFSPWYKQLVERLSSSGASMIVFIIAFTLAGNVTGPAASMMRELWLETVSGLELESS